MLLRIVLAISRLLFAEITLEQEYQNDLIQLKFTRKTFEFVGHSAKLGDIGGSVFTVSQGEEKWFLHIIVEKTGTSRFEISR